MFDKIASVGTTFDWITPFITEIQNFRNRPSVGYSVPVDAGWSAYQISDLLNDYGIKHWGLHIYDSTILFRQRVAQAAFTQYLFERNGIAYCGGMDVAGMSARSGAEVRTRARSVDQGQAPPGKRQSPGALLDHTLGAVDRIAGRLSNAGRRT